MAILNENEPMPMGDKPNDQTEEYESLIKYCKKLLDRSKQATGDFRKQWPTNYKFVFGGQQWPLQRPEYRFSEVINTTWSDIMTEVGIMTDARPKVDYTPAEPSDIPFCDILKEINDINWNKYRWNEYVAQNILDSKWVHVSHCEVKWNPELEGGLGDVEHVVLDPYGCYWDNFAKDEDSLRYFIYLEPTPTEKLKAEYPDFKDQISSDIDVIDFNQFGNRVDYQSDQVGFNLSNGVRGRRPSPDNKRYGSEPMTMKARVWLRDDSLEEMVDEKQDETGTVKKEYVLKKKFPQGRYIEFCNNVILCDHENGVKMPDGSVIPYKHGMIPIVRWVNYSYPREYAGENEVTHNMGPNIVSNYVWSFILDVMKQSSNPKEVFSAANREAAEKSSNEPGQVLVLPDFAGYRREAGEGLPAGLNTIADMAMKMKDKISGLQDVMRGAVDPSITSGIMMDSYVEAAQVRPRMKSRVVDQSLQRLGKLDASLYLQFYTSQRTYAITNKDGWPQFISFFVTDDGQGGQVAKIVKQLPDETGRYTQQPEQQIPVKGLPDIQITTGSSIPFQKGVQYNRDKELAQMGMIDQKAMLDDIEYPKRDEIIARMQQAAQDAAAQQPMKGK